MKTISQSSAGIGTFKHHRRDHNARFFPGFIRPSWCCSVRFNSTREEVVDRAVVEVTKSREQYLEALLAVAKSEVCSRISALCATVLKKTPIPRTSSGPPC